MAQPLTQSFPDHSKAVLDQLNNQRFCGAFCDILLQVEDYDFKLHKCLLAALSAKLQTMLFNMRPECGGILTLRDISVTGFRYIVEYLYTGTLHLNTLHVHEVLAAAQNLEIREIEKACYDFLKSTVSTSSHASGNLTGSGLPDPAGRYAGYHVSSQYATQTTYQAPQPNIPSSILNYNYKEDYMKLIESLQVDPTPSDQQQQQPELDNGSAIPAPTTTITQSFHPISAPPSSSSTQPNCNTADHRDRETSQFNDGEVMRTILSIFSQETFPARENNKDHQTMPAYAANVGVKPQISAMLTPVGENNVQKLSVMPVQSQSHMIPPVRMETVRRDLTQAMQSVCEGVNSQTTAPPTLVAGENKTVLTGPLPSITSIQKLPAHLASLPHLSFGSGMHPLSAPPPQPLPQPHQAPPPLHQAVPPQAPIIPTSAPPEEQDKDLMYTSETDDTDAGSNHAASDDEDDNDDLSDKNAYTERPLTIHLENDSASRSEPIPEQTPRGESLANDEDSDDNLDAETDKPKRKRNRPMHIKKRLKLEAEAQRQKEQEEREKQASKDESGRRKAVAAAALASLSQTTKSSVRSAARGRAAKSQRATIKKGKPGASSSSNNKRYQKKFTSCDKCGRKFFNKEQFVKHMELHKKEMLYSCHVCGLKYARREDFTRHMRSHSNETFLCGFCNDLYTDAKKFKSHMKNAHHDNKPFRCHQPGCTFRSDRPSYVEEHAVIHSDIKTHTCDKCGKQFSQRNGLRIHKQSCYEQRSYLCDICGAKFNQLQSMKSHRRLHTGEKPHTCMDCGKAFTDHTNYKRHRRIHDNTFPYPCPYCDKRYRHSNSLKAHVKSHKLPLPEGATVPRLNTPVAVAGVTEKDRWENIIKFEESSCS